MKMNLQSILVAAAVFLPASASAVTLVPTSDPGFYHDSIGTALNGTNGGDTATGMFPILNDSSVSFPTAPDLTTASGALGNWLTNPGSLNANWTAEASIPNSWTPGDEVHWCGESETLSHGDRRVHWAAGGVGGAPRAAGGGRHSPTRRCPTPRRPCTT